MNTKTLPLNARLALIRLDGRAAVSRQPLRPRVECDPALQAPKPTGARRLKSAAYFAVFFAIGWSIGPYFFQL